MSIIVAGAVLLFLPTIVRGFLFGLMVAAAVIAINVVLAVGVVAVAQTSATDCYRYANGTRCQTRDAQGRTSAITTCWPSGTGQTCQTQEYPNGDRPQR